MAIFWQGKPRKKPNPEIREPRRQPSTFNSPVLHRLVAWCPKRTERGGGAPRRPPQPPGAARGGKNFCVFGCVDRPGAQGPPAPPPQKCFGQPRPSTKEDQL